MFMLKSGHAEHVADELHRYEAAYKQFTERAKPLIKKMQPIPPDFWTSLKLVDWPNCS